jgi:hemoglobin
MRDQWLQCMGQAMIDVQLPEQLWERLLKAFFDTADWMRNQAN